MIDKILAVRTHYNSNMGVGVGLAVPY